MNAFYTLRKWQSNLQPMQQIAKATAQKAVEYITTAYENLEPVHRQVLAVIVLTLTVVAFSVSALSPKAIASAHKPVTHAADTARLKPEECVTYNTGAISSDTIFFPLDKAVLLVQDPDWQLITSQKLTALEKFVKSGANLQTFDFSDEEQVAKVLGQSVAQVQGTIALLHEAKLRLQEKYDLPWSGACDACDKTLEERNAQNSDVILSFRRDRLAYENVRSFLLKDKLMMPQQQCHTKFEYCWWEEADDYCYWVCAGKVCG